MSAVAPTQEITIVFVVCDCGCGTIIPPEPTKRFVDDSHRDRYNNERRRKTNRRVRVPERRLK